MLVRCLSRKLGFLVVELLLDASNMLDEALPGLPYFLLNDVRGFPVNQGKTRGFSLVRRLEATEESRDLAEMSSRILLDSLRTLSVSTELIVVQLVDSLSAPSIDDRVSPRRSSRLCDPEGVSRFELTESVLEFALQNLAAAFLFFAEDRRSVNLFDAVESVPALDGRLGLGDLKFLPVIGSTIRANNRRLLDSI